MKRSCGQVVFSMALLAIPFTSEAQIPEDMKRQGYVFVAPGVLLEGEGAAPTATLEVGGGFQGLVYRGLGLGFDASWMGFGDCFSCGFGVLGSIDASYHFVRPSRKLVPFVVGGFGGIAGPDEAIALANFGGGINYWFGNGMALRIEVRDHLPTNEQVGIHIVGVRVGLTF